MKLKKELISKKESTIDVELKASIDQRSEYLDAFWTMVFGNWNKINIMYRYSSYTSKLYFS